MKIRSLTTAFLLFAVSAVQAQNFELQYQSGTGALDLVKLGDTNATTVELKSEGGQITGDRPARRGAQVVADHELHGSSGPPVAFDVSPLAGGSRRCGTQGRVPSSRLEKSKVATF